MTWSITGFDIGGNLVFDHDLHKIDETELAVVLGLTDARQYSGGERPIPSEGLALLQKRFGLSFDPEVEYFIGYASDYPGQVLYYIPAPDDGPVCESKDKNQ